MAVAAIPLIATVVSTAFSVVGRMRQASAAQSAANYNARVADRNAKMIEQQGAMDAEAQRRQNIIRLGAMRGAYGASGITVDGSPIDVLESSATNMEMDRQTILRRVKLRSLGYESDADLSRMESSYARSNGLWGAAGTLISGAAQGYGQYSSMSNPGTTAGTSLMADPYPGMSVK